MDINIRPQVNILGVLRHLNYKPWYALAEFVDNAVVSALQHGLARPDRPLKVTIDLFPEDGGRLIIRDNAAGISISDFPRAFRAAEVPPDRTGLSEFGMGMKSAASWFAKEWRVITSVSGEPIERTVHFDLDQIQQSQQETIRVKESSADERSHFTTVELCRLNQIPQTKTLAKIKGHLSSIYRDFIRRGLLELEFRGERLAFKEVEPLIAAPASDPQGVKQRWVKAISFSLDDTHHVSGFAALRAKGSTSEAGFALLRRGRVILGSGDETYRPPEIFGRATTHTYQRLYGELTLEGFEVSHTKDGFRWGEYEEAFLDALSAALSEGDVDLLKQAANYRLQPLIDNRQPIEAAVTSVVASVESHFEHVADQALARPDTDEPIPDVVVTTSREPIVQRATVTLDSETWVVDLEATLEDGVVDWLAVGAERHVVPPSRGALPEVHVKVAVSLAHPFSRRFLGASQENAELIMTLASSVGLALALGKRSGARSQSILNRINQLARETFAMLPGRSQ